MKALYLIFHGFAAHNGISKKIFYQKEALMKCGLETKLCYQTLEKNGVQKRMIDDMVLEDYGNGIMAKINKRINYKALTGYILSNQIDLLYIRNFHNANPFLNKMLKTVRNSGVKVVMEIPTYPYDNEFKKSPFKHKIRFFIDKLYRMEMSRHIDKYVTFSDDNVIFGTPTINISNGIDFDQISLKTTQNNDPKKLNLIGVAEIHFWHGLDRVITGLAEYYKKKREVEVSFHIVGAGHIPAETELLHQLVKDNHLEKYVFFHGKQAGTELDQLFEEADMGIASLGRHRSGITKIKTLKTREYAARGIPFVYSEIDDDFENMPYIIKAPADETPLDIEKLVDFYKDHTFIPENIRNSIIDKLSWNIQMKKVIDETFN